MTDWRQRNNAPEAGTIVGPISEVGPGGREYVFGRGIGAFRLFVVRYEDGVRAYLNLCPHYSLPLNHRADEFLTRNGDRIMCRQHLALFAIEDGRCLDGACEGKGLQTIPVILDDNIMKVG